MPSLKENQATFKMWVEAYSIALKNQEMFMNDEIGKKGFYDFMLDFKGWLYESIHNYLAENKYNEKYEKTIRTYCNFIRDKIIPICNFKIKYYNGNKTRFINSHVFLYHWLNLEDDFYALASYRNLSMLARYLERGKVKDRIWDKTIHLFENFFDYTQKLIFGELPIELIRASYFPGAGKTYAGNILCAFWFGYDSTMSILRITYSENLCKTFIQQTAGIIDSEQYRKVFPQFNLGKGLGNSELYLNYSVAIGFQFSFSSTMNLYASTREGQVTGKRGKVLIIDDITKGVEEAYNEDVHKGIVNKYDAEWTNRGDSSYQPVFALGTMWNEKDLLNVLYQRAKKDYDNKIIFDEKYDYTEIVLDENGRVSAVFIATPILDYLTDESTCPLRYDTIRMRKRRENMDEALWNAVYQQRPTPPQDVMFSYNHLETYDDETYPQEEMKNNETECWSFIDSTRKGMDYFAMGIFKRYRIDKKKWSKWYLIDCIFEQKTTKELMYDIVSKIAHHQITKIGYENNIDVSFEELLKTKLKEYGYSGKVNIDSFFSSNIAKEHKIRNASYGMLNEIIYPALKLYSISSPMGKAMVQFTNYSIYQKYGDHDDFPDMIAMFVKYYCEASIENTMKVFNRIDLGLR